QSQYEQIIDVRGIGLLGAISFRRDLGAEPLTPNIVAEALKRGLICRSVVYEGQDTLAFAPPFIINQQQMDDMLDIVSASIRADRKSTRLNSSHVSISYAVFCLKKKLIVG